jgi:hypothetical protein
MSDENKSSRSAILSSVKTPLALLALIVLVTEVILGVLANKATGSDFTLLTSGMILLLFSIIVVLYFKAGALTSNEKSEIVVKDIHDLFVSSPMAAFAQDSDFKIDRTRILDLITCFKKELRFKTIFYAGAEITSLTDFDAEDLSAKDDMDALLGSKYFVLIYPEKLVSSVLVEAGAAIAYKKKSIYFVRQRDHLPFLLKQAEMAFPGIVKIYEFEKHEDIKRLVEKNGLNLFPKE